MTPEPRDLLNAYARRISELEQELIIARAETLGVQRLLSSTQRQLEAIATATPPATVEVEPAQEG